MARRHLPVAIVYPSAQADPIVVGAVPTLNTRKHYGYGALQGLIINGSLANVVPVGEPQVPLKSPVFPMLQPSDTIPNVIRVAQMVALNLWSPSSHSKAAHTDEPVPALQPDPRDLGWQMPPKQGRGTGGHYTLPAPPNVPNWPIFMDRVMR